MAVFFVCLNPVKLLPRVLHLRFIADPGRARKQCISTEDVEKSEK
jgi:hypothetical protein